MNNKQQIVCNHNWINSNFILASNPPQIPRICALCGKEDTLTFGPNYQQQITYEQVKERFKKENK